MIYKLMTYDLSTKARSIKDTGWYWIDRRILRRFGKKLGASGIAVYNALACFADAKSQQCYPTHRVIAQLLGVSCRTVARKVKCLEKLGLVRSEKAGSSFRYLLLSLPAEATKETSGGDKRDTSQVTPGHTNNNQLTIVNNNSMYDDKNLFSIKSFRPKNREELLALDLAEALNDHRGLNAYLSYARRFPEPFLRRTLGEVKEIPAEKIKKGRAALFHYLIRKHA